MIEFAVASFFIALFTFLGIAIIKNTAEMLGWRPTRHLSKDNPETQRLEKINTILVVQGIFVLIAIISVIYFWLK